MEATFLLLKRTRTLIYTLTLLVFSALQSSAQYCIPFISNGCSGDDYIQSFSTSGGITNISNLSSNCGTASTGISQYLGMVHTTTLGGTVNFTVVNTPSWQEGYMMWVDYNGDGDFSDANENVWNGGLLNNGQTVSSSFIVPTSATPGTTRMRVMCVFVTTNFSPCANQTFGEVEDYSFTINAPCADTPDIYSVSAPDPQCANKPFTVGLSGMPQTDLTYAWSYSDDGIKWQPVTSTISTFGNFTDIISADRWYRCFITCTNSGLSYTTPARLVHVAPFYYCYCDNAAAVPTGLDIGNVTVNALPADITKFTNGLASPATSNNTAKNTYSTFQFSLQPIVMYRDSAFKLSVQQITSSATMPANTNVAAYVDFDRNGIFDASEKVMNKVINATSTIPNTELATFTVPATAKVGLTGMRVILSLGNPDSCGTITGEGEVEDYLVDMRYEPCDNAANPGTIDASSLVICPQYEYTLTDTTYEKRKSELVRTWQVSGDNISWIQADNKINNDSLNRTFIGQPLYYRVRMVCPAKGGDTTYATTVNIKGKDGYKCYCFSEAVGGTKDSSDLGGFTIGNYTFNTGGPHLINPLAHNKRTDHTDDAPIMLYTDSVYSITTFQTQSSQVHADAKVTVFIDFNNNKQYDVPYERVFTDYTSISNFTLDDKITIPSSVITGVPTGMRVIVNNNIAPNDPSDLACGIYVSGETHDYIVQFQAKKFATGIANANKLIDQFGLYPNPTNGKFMVQFNTVQELKDVAITVTSMTGQQVFHQSYAHTSGLFSKEVDMSNIAKGVYYVELNTDGQRVTQKLVIK